MGIGGRGFVLQKFVQIARQLRLAVPFLDILDPLQKAPVVDRQQMGDIRVRRAVPERLEEFIEQIVGRAPLPRRGTIQIHVHGQTVVPPSVQDTRRRCPGAQAETLREMLEKRGLAVAGIAAQDDQAGAPFHDVAV